MNLGGELAVESVVVGGVLADISPLVLSGRVRSLVRVLTDKPKSPSVIVFVSGSSSDRALLPQLAIFYISLRPFSVDFPDG